MNYSQAEESRLRALASIDHMVEQRKYFDRSMEPFSEINALFNSIPPEERKMVNYLEIGWKTRAAMTKRYMEGRLRSGRFDHDMGGVFQPGKALNMCNEAASDFQMIKLVGSRDPNALKFVRHKESENMFSTVNEIF